VGESEQTALILLDRAHHALSQASSLAEVRDVRDQAEAVRSYFKQQRASLALQNQCAEIKLRAERRLGELLAETVRPGRQSSHAVRKGLPEGISYMQSHRWQLMAAVPAEQFEAHVAEVVEWGGELTTAAVLRLARSIRDQAKRQASQPEGSAQMARAEANFLPLEALWPTQQYVLLKLAERYGWLADDLRVLSHGYEEWPDEARASLEVRLEEVSAVVTSAADAVDKAATHLHDLAAEAGKMPIPWGGDQETLLAVNASQKNACGYCREVGCWSRAKPEGRCRSHFPGVDCSTDEAIEEPFEKAPCLTFREDLSAWTVWGLEAFE
jgi:hypothetical protein